jgi:hypothetical protein
MVRIAAKLANIIFARSLTPKKERVCHESKNERRKEDGFSNCSG